MKRNYICIACPVGCHLELDATTQEDIKISGNKCGRGEIYAREEYAEPKRMVTATCRTGDERLDRIPVKTTKPILKEHIQSLLDEIYSVKLAVPVKRGQVIIQNYKNTGVDVVATRSLL